MIHSTSECRSEPGSPFTSASHEPNTTFDTDGAGVETTPSADSHQPSTHTSAAIALCDTIQRPAIGCPCRARLFRLARAFDLAAQVELDTNRNTSLLGRPER